MTTQQIFSVPNSVRGMTLLEVLVALIVLSIGLIGLAGLQSTSLRMNNSATHRSQATALAYEMADRVRANAAAAAAPAWGYDDPTPTFQSSCGTTAGCSSETAMAQHDMFLWNQRIGLLLPLGVGTICRDSTPQTVACDGVGEAYVIRVTWDDNRSGVADPNDANENISLAFRL